ncbi:Cell division protein ZipA [hydrothermal vent metagenome]|uniref:Cell division protein ZipA n=1 Tax=hydrothermal vent metagenome TaxID=652676 RepID=A0A3B1ARG5_9ZZZZ
MDTLRIILIIIGVIFIIGIYFFQRKKTLPGNINKITERIVPLFFGIKTALNNLFDSEKKISQEQNSVQRSHNELSKEQLASMSSLVANNARNGLQKNIQFESQNEHSTQGVSIEHGQSQVVSVANGDELLITLTVIPKPEHFFSGDDIIVACKLAGLQLGEFNIFHRYALVDDKVQITPVCSLVNLFEPGSFDIAAMSDFSTEGLSLFMQLPGPVDGREAFIILMDVSEKLSLHLNATICDETRSVLTAQTISHLKEKVENYRFKLRMASLKNH